MKYRQVGRTGLRVSSVSIGGWLTLGGSVDGKGSLDILHRAVDREITFFDLADVYARGGAERAFGGFLREYVSSPSRSRGDLVVSSKVFWPMSDNPNDRGLSRKHIIESCEKSLERIGTDYLDIYFCHRFDPSVPIDETARAMDDLVRQGKILYWGTSVWSGEQLRAAHTVCSQRGLYEPVVEQPRYNLFDRHIEEDVVPACEEHGMGLVVWSPLAQGMLTGKYDSGVPDRSRAATSRWLEKEMTESNLERSRRFSTLAREMGHAPASLALAWALHKPGISSVITGASRPEQIESNADAAEIELSRSDLDAIESIFG